MEGACRHDEPGLPGAPPPEVVHAVHDRYLFEVVEDLGLCPFARRSRELGRVHRPLVYTDTPSAEATAQRVHDLVVAHPNAEIVLVTFVHPGPAPYWAEPRPFDDFVKQVRARYDALGGPVFFMVGFHPRSGELDPEDRPVRLTPDSLVAHLRRTPDPVIQCVRAEVLERVRAQAQQAAHAKLLAEAERLDPRLVAILRRSIQPDSSLSADIAKRNFEHVAQAEGRAALEARIADIQRERDEAYAPWRAGT